MYLPWDIEEYLEKVVKKGQDKKRVKFPNPKIGRVSVPMTLVDSNGKIILWYLPELLPAQEKVSFKYVYCFWKSNLLNKVRHT